MRNTNKPKNLIIFFWTFYKPHKFAIFFFLVFSSLVGLHGFFNSYFTKLIIDSLSNLEDRTQVYASILFPIVFVALNFEIYNLSWRGINYIIFKVLPVIKINMIKYLFEHVHLQSYRFFLNNLGGAISNNIIILSDNIEKITGTVLVRIIRGFVQIIVTFIAMYSIHPIFFMAISAWTLCFISLSWIFSKKVRKLSDDYAYSQSCVAGKLVDSVANFSNIKLFSKLDYEISYLSHFLAYMKQKFQNKERFLIKFYFLQGFSITCLEGIVVYFLIQLRMENQITLGVFAFILSMSFYVTESVWTFTEQIDQLNDAIGKCKQSVETLYKPTEVQDKMNAKPLKVLKGEICFENVQFKYKKDEPLFENLNLTIKPGEKIGIVGYSGSGKSTFANLLLRLYDIQDGSIIIDQQSIYDVSQESLHNAIGFISQESMLFHRSLMENIRFGLTTASDQEVIEAAKKAHIHSFISQLNAGYDTLIGERGLTLSGGQRQLIAIARVILKNAPILILDEATSQLDSITDISIQKILDELMVGRTSIIIAHRLSTVMRMDRIIVFNCGRIIECGTHQALLENQGIYKALWNAQMNNILSSKYQDSLFSY